MTTATQQAVRTLAARPGEPSTRHPELAVRGVFVGDPRRHEGSKGPRAPGASCRALKERSSMNASKMKIVYVISERNSKSYWNRVGVAFVNGDGSINVKLDAVPVSGELQIRDYVARDEATLERRTNGNAAAQEDFA
jgi:hypothetical protein